MRSPSIQRWLSRAAVAAAAPAAIAAFAVHETDPAAAAEGLYLARLTAGILLAVAVLAPAGTGGGRRPGGALAASADAELGLGATLAVTAAWALPAGPLRGAAVVLVLTACLALTAARRLIAATDRRRRWEERGTDSAVVPVVPERAGAARGWQGHLVAACALCLGCQVLLRGELLLAIGAAGATGVAGARPWAALVALPLAAGAALALLWRRYGALPALAAGAAAAALAPGWTVATTLALIALAGGSQLAAPAGGSELAAPGPGGQLAASGSRSERTASGGGGRLTGFGDRGRPGGAILRSGAAVAALLLPVVWQPRSGWAAALAALALARPAIALGAAVPLALLSRFGPLPGALAAHASWREGASSAAWLLLLVPAAAIVACGWGTGEHPDPAGGGDGARGSAQRAAASAGAWRRWRLAAALLVAFATPWLPDRSVLAAPIALAALALPATGVAAGIAAAWSAALLGATALLAAYPWLRRDPLADALGLFGATAGPRSAIALAGAALLLGGALALGRRRPAARQARMAATATAATLLAALLLPSLTHPRLSLLAAGETVLLDRAHPSWIAEISPRRTAILAVQSDLINAAGLADGTLVAHVQLLATGATQDLELRAGRDTGEWSARRPDVAAAARLHSPAPWVSWVAGPFLGQRYRCRLLLPHPDSFARIRIDLAAGLPAGTALALHQVEVAP